MKRYVTLDSLRGLAALVVVLHHYAGSVPGLHEALSGSILLAPFVAGPSAVYIFFVLSGFVLYLTFTAKDDAKYLPFAAKRVARIYPPVVVTVLGAALLAWLIQPAPVPDLTDWFSRSSWSAPVTWTMIARHVLLLDGPLPLDNVLWSLVVELRLSLVFPVLALLVRRHAWLTLAGSFVLYVVFRRIANHAGLHWPVNPFITGQYIFLFAAGAALAKWSSSIEGLFERHPQRPLLAALLLVGVALVTYPPDRQGGLLTNAGAILLVAIVAAHPGLRAALSVRPALWLGRISYSLYLTHLVVLLAIIHGAEGRVPSLPLVAVALLAALPVAALIYETVERPSIRFGRWVSSRV